MSLLLQALQKAAKNRDGDGRDDGTPTPETQASLTLEPLVEPQLSSEREPDRSDDPKPAAKQEYAASLLKANETPRYTVLDWIGDHHMLSFLAAAAVFAICYGTYVYIQVSNPGGFQPPPPVVSAPIQSAAVTTPVSTQARVSGLPDASGEFTATSVERPLPGTQSAADNADKATEMSAVRQSGAVNSDQTTPPGNSEASVRVVRKTPLVQPQSRPPSTTKNKVFTDNDGVEVIEIPASPSVSFPDQSAKTPRNTITASAQYSQVDPTLLAAYEALQLGEYEKARTLYTEVLAENANDKDALLGLAAIAWKQGQTNVASQFYGRVLENEPRNSHAQAGLIAILGSADPTAAESKLKQLIARDPSGFLYFTLGNLYAEQVQWPRAQQAYFRALQFQPDNPDYAFNLAVGLEHLGQTKPALDYYRKALDLSFKKGRANFDQKSAIARVGQLSAQVE